MASRITSYNVCYTKLLRLDYDAGEDRLVLRISTHDQTEVRLWLTRRFTKALWRNNFV